MNFWTQLRIFLPVTFFLSTVSALSQQLPSAVVASAAPANASVAYTKSWTPFHNPAILSEIRKNTVAVGYENRFQMKELSSMTASGSITTNPVDIGIQLGRYGYSEYNETQAGVSVARQFVKEFTMGVGLNYYSVYLSPDGGSKGTVIAQIGLSSQVLEHFFVGFHAYNPFQTSIDVGATEMRIPSVFSLGGAYHFGESVIWVAQADKEVDNPVVWRTGFEYQVVKEFSVRLGGYGSNSFVPSFGASVNMYNICLDVNFERHPTLGFNSIAALSYRFE
jgi:hypothetical protein